MRTACAATTAPSTRAATAPTRPEAGASRTQRSAAPPHFPPALRPAFAARPTGHSAATIALLANTTAGCSASPPATRAARLEPAAPTALRPAGTQRSVPLPPLAPTGAPTAPTPGCAFPATPVPRALAIPASPTQSARSMAPRRPPGGRPAEVEAAGSAPTGRAAARRSAHRCSGRPRACSVSLRQARAASSGARCTCLATASANEGPCSRASQPRRSPFETAFAYAFS